MTPRILSPGDTIGILGGGQLARMLALAAAPFGLKTHIYAPAGDNPAFDVCAAVTQAPYEDEAALRGFASRVAAITYEFENIPVATACMLEGLAPLRPGSKALDLTQDRLTEKRFIVECGLSPAPFAPVDDLDSLAAAMAALGLPAILKTRRLGYDGKGQAVIRDAQEAAAAFGALGQVPCVLEGFVPFAYEVSVVLARGIDGHAVAYDLCQNEHRGGILAQTVVPSKADARVRAEAVAAATRLIEALDYVGVMAVEMFVLDTGKSRIVVNEIAPRVHNSGHWTIEGATTSQFAQHIRAIAGWPLGKTGLTGRQIIMNNLIGADIALWRDCCGETGADDADCYAHVYGKAEVRPGRKMGHVTRIVR